jgi:hypothetical protein
MSAFEREGLEEAEMYLGFAENVTARLFESPEECDIAAVRLFIDRARRILKPRIDRDLHEAHLRAIAAQSETRQ